MSAQKPTGITPKQREQMLEFCRLAATWYLNNQNTEAHPWGGVGGSADLGRFLYQYTPIDGKCRANGVWGQGVAIMGLLPLAARLDWQGTAHREAALAAGSYLKSLQILDQRDPRLFGALHERDPQDNWIYPRDGATGCMALCVLFRETKEEEYLYRARLFGDWFLRNAMSKEGWPAHSYRFDKREAEHRPPAIWQAGAGLAFYYLYRLTGEKRYIDEGLRPIMEGYKRLSAAAASEPPKEVSSNDDFAAIAAMGACQVYHDRPLADIVCRHAQAIARTQDADGSCPGLDAACVAGLTWHNIPAFLRSQKRRESPAFCGRAIEKVARFVPGLQERDPRDPRAYGGLYGQTSFGVSRTIIHHRSTGYALIFMLRTEGGTDVPAYNVFGW